MLDWKHWDWTKNSLLWYSWHRWDLEHNILVHMNQNQIVSAYFSHYQISAVGSCHKENRIQDSYLDWQKHLHNMALTYLRELIEPHQPSHTLCSADQLLLKVPKLRHNIETARSPKKLSSCENTLPANIRAYDSQDTIKSALKTYPFNADESWRHYLL